MSNQSDTKEFFPGWLPTQVARYYGFPLSEATGKGQKIAIISLGGQVDIAELEKDFRAMRVPMPELSLHDVDEGEIEEWQNQMETGETHLDIEVIGALCPEAMIGIYRGPNSLQGFADAINEAVADGYKVLSISWEFSESDGIDQSVIEKALVEANAKGVTVCCSTGDGGSSNTRSGNQCVPAADSKAHVGYPASSSNVLACGGTELVLSSPAPSGAKIYREEVWNNSAMGGGATGGGVSEIFARPSWQKAAGIEIVSANTGATGRVTPDVAGLAAYLSGGDWKIFEQGEGQASGGTSAVAPLWASLITLVNEKRNRIGKKPLGFLNERLYKLVDKSELFNDVVVGNNRPTATSPGYDAAPGLDACTGWGTPRGVKLFPALVNLD